MGHSALINGYYISPPFIVNIYGKDVGRPMRRRLYRLESVGGVVMTWGMRSLIKLCINQPPLLIEYNKIFLSSSNYLL